MSVIKRLGKSQSLRSLLCWLAASYVRLVYATGKWEFGGCPDAVTFAQQGKPFIVAFWHGHLLMMPKLWPYKQHPFHMLISQHRDGELIARTVAHFNISWVAGSSTRGGGAALRSMLKSLKAGEYVGITPDGPHGPVRQASDGIVAVARMSGCPIIPGTWSARRQKLLGTWDIFRIPLPFSQGILMWGDPIYVAKDSDAAGLEQARLQVQAGLNTLTDQADAAMGHAI